LLSDTDYLRENAVQRVGMDERDEMAPEAGTRLAVEDLRTLGGELVDRGGDIADGDADVVHPGPSAGEKAPDVGVRPERRDELDATVAEAQIDGLDPLGLQPAAELDLRAEERPVCLHGRVEVLDREGDVVHGAHVHATDPNDSVSP
jgi:hypothetical protein